METDFSRQPDLVYSNAENGDFHSDNCRVCLSQNSSLFSLFAPHKQENTIADLINFVAGIDVQENDNFPQFVCEICLKKLEDAHDIKKQCLKTDQQLRDQFSFSNVSVKKEESNFSEDNLEDDRYSETNDTYDPILCEFANVQVKLEDDDDDDGEYAPENKKKGRPKKVHRRRPEPKRKNQKVANGVICRNCDKKYIDKYTLKRHTKRCTKIYYPCEICRIAIKYKLEFLKHIKAHEMKGDPPIIQCGTCQEKLYYRDSIDNHNCIIEKKERFICYLCNHLEFKDKNELVNHLRSHKIEGVLICPQPECHGKRFIPPNSFYHHLESHFNPANTCCSICGQFFTDRLLHSLHKRKHKSTVLFTCDYCGRDIISKQKLLKHMMASHLASDNLLCDQCCMSFKFPNLLRKHQVKEHGAIGDYQCEICGVWYLAQSSLNNHMKRHMEKPRFECEVCGESFKNNTELKIHVELVHVRKTNHQCHYCLKYFKYAWHLATHILIHTGEKNFECVVCSKRFITKAALDEHMRAHTGETPYSCHLCEKKYKSHSGLRRHFKKFHKIDTTNMKNLFSRNNKQIVVTN